jgi:anhydro-N-acetylmuramic acid kinase
MTGTSIDALDVALVAIQGNGLAMRASFKHGLAVPLADLAPRLRAVAEQQPITARDIASLACDFAHLHARAVEQLLAQTSTPRDQVAQICVHGQTVYHAPPLSWQLFEPAPLAHATHIPVVYNLRQADLAAGGQGAPITPLADAVLYGAAMQPLAVGSASEDYFSSVAIINLGGFANYTSLASRNHAIDPTSISGGDLCACNQLLDAVARTMLRQPFDHDGNAANAGNIHDAALEDIEGILRTQSLSRRSLGTGDEVGEWISRFRAHVAPNDLALTACEAIASTIADRLRDLMPQLDQLILAGGGVRNRALVEAIASNSTARVTTSTQHGIPIEFREAACFAVLGALCQDRVPITLSSVTGVRVPLISGQWCMP